MQASNIINNLLFGMYRCIIEDVELSEPKLLARVRVIGLWDELLIEHLPWAEYVLPCGARVGDGDFKPSKKGDFVWCMFDGGDARYPLIIGSCYYAPDGTPNLPPQSWGDNEYQHKRTAAQPIPSPTKYHDCRVSTQYGIMIEQTSDGAYRTTHKDTGTAVEVTKDGELVLYCAKNLFESTEANKLTEAKLNITVYADRDILIESKQANVTINASMTVSINGKKIHLNDGQPIVTTGHPCHFIGGNHMCGSSTVTAEV